jgi:hypothetical protein
LVEDPRHFLKKIATKDRETRINFHPEALK